MAQTTPVKVCCPACTLRDPQTLSPNSRSPSSDSLEEARRGKYDEQQARGKQSDIKEGRRSVATAQYVHPLTWLWILIHFCTLL